MTAFAETACTPDEAPEASTRVCGLPIWHKPATRDAHIEIVGDWNDWKRPGLLPERREDGWIEVLVDVPAGDHAYAIIEDGVWLSDARVPRTAFHEGHEVALGIALDCDRPALRVEDVSATADGRAFVRASFLVSRSGAALDPRTVSAVSRDGLSLSTVSSGSASLRLEASGLKRGKYTFAIKARDARGVEAEEAMATVWVESRPWDLRDAIIYQVVLDRFRGDNGPLAPPAHPGARAGGTLAGLRAAVEQGEIEALGINTLWLSPLYKNPEAEFAGVDGHSYSGYHGYWPVASRLLDSRVASEEELDRFMRVAHERGLRVLFDVVPNHVHEQHAWAGERPDWFKRDCVCGQGACDWATHIRTCWFTPYLPDLDWTNAAAARAATSEIMWWFDRWGADGLRIDAVPMMPRAATRQIAHAVRARYEHPGHVPYILGENFTGPGGYQSLRYDLGPFGLDGSFHFPLMWTLRAAVAEERAPMADIIESFLAGEQAWAGSGAVMGMMLGNHDVARFASVSAGNASGDSWIPAPQALDPVVYQKQRVALASVLTLPGAPVVYYGDEIGLAGRSDPDSRRVMPAAASLLASQVETRDFVRRLGRFRACSEALRRGTMRTVLAEPERVVFAREIPGDPTGLVMVALARRPSLPIDVPLPTGAPAALVDVVTGQAFDAGGGALSISPDAFGVHVFAASDGPCRGN